MVGGERRGPSRREILPEITSDESPDHPFGNRESLETRFGLNATCAEYVQRIDRKPVQTTLERNLALLTGKVTAMEVLESFNKSRWTPEMVAVQVNG